MITKSFWCTGVLLFTLFCASIASALPTTWYINGDFGDTVRTSTNEPYPFPELFYGHFEGVFSYDLDEYRINKNLPMHNVLIGIYTNTNDLADTITTGQNNYIGHSWNTEGAVPRQIFNLIFGTSAGIAYGVQDLRVLFTGNVAHPGTAFRDGFLETDTAKERPRDYWNLMIDSAELTHISGPLEPIPPLKPIPEPTTMLLLGTGLIGLAISRRKRFKKK